MLAPILSLALPFGGWPSIRIATILGEAARRDLRAHSVSTSAQGDRAIEWGAIDVEGESRAFGGDHATGAVSAVFRSLERVASQVAAAQQTTEALLSHCASRQLSFLRLGRVFSDHEQEFNRLELDLMQKYSDELADNPSLGNDPFKALAEASRVAGGSFSARLHEAIVAIDRAASHCDRAMEAVTPIRDWLDRMFEETAVVGHNWNGVKSVTTVSDAIGLANAVKGWADRAADKGPNEHLADEWRTLVSPQAGIDAEQVMLCAAMIAEVVADLRGVGVACSQFIEAARQTAL